MLGESHGPADDGALRGEDHLQGLFDGGAVESGRGERLVPVGLGRGGGELLVAVGVSGDERLVDGASVARISLFRRRKRAWSPPMRIWRNRSLRAVPLSMPCGVCGFLKRSRPASGSGFTEMIFAPADLACSRAESIRGWLVPGFCPAMMIRSAWWRSSRDTEPLPTPIVSVSAEPEDSWHMLEQSGRLLVPNSRAKSWRRNAASLLVRPEV